MCRNWVELVKDLASVILSKSELTLAEAINIPICKWDRN